MSNEVFGVNAARVEEQVCHLIEVYKKDGKEATLKEWGFNLDMTPYNKSDVKVKFGPENMLIRRFLWVLFDEQNDVFINEVLNTTEPRAIFELNPAIGKQEQSLFDILHNKTNSMLTLSMRMLVDAWAVYNLPILPKVLDLVVNHIYENLESFIDFDGLKEYLEDIEWEYEENKTPNSKPFEEYLRSCIEEDLVVEWVKNDYFLKQVFDAVEDEVAWEYLEFVWTRFCSSHEFNSALYFVKDTVKKIVPKVLALASSVG